MLRSDEQILNAWATPVVTAATGAAAIATSYAPGVAFWLEGVTCHFNSAPTTSEDFTITLNAKAGAVYDAVLMRVNLALAAGVDIAWLPDGGPRLCEAGDAIDVAFPNSNAKTYGLRIVGRLA